MTWKKVQKLSQPSIKLVWTFSFIAFNENVMQRNELVGSCCVTQQLGAEWQFRWVGWVRWREVQGGVDVCMLMSDSCCCTQNQHNIVKQVSSNWVSHVVLVVNTHLPMQEKQETQLGRSPGGGHGNPLWYSCLENPMDRGAGWATVYRVAKSQTWLKLCSMPTSSN